MAAVTPREREALILICQGKDGPALGEAMGITHHSARLHLMPLFKKLGATNRTELALIALFGGIPSLDFIEQMVDSTLIRRKIAHVETDNTGSL